MKRHPVSPPSRDSVRRWPVYITPAFRTILRRKVKRKLRTLLLREQRKEEAGE